MIILIKMIAAQMRLSLIILTFMVITCQISAQGVTRQGRNTTSDTEFVTKNGKIVDIPALSRYGEELLIRVPVNLVTASITNVTSNSAISGGDIAGDNGLPVLVRGICWNTYPEPTIAHFKTSDGTGTGAFTSQLTVLMPSTTYYLRAYATNISGLTYGEEISFTTLPRTDPSECLIAWYPFNGDASEATGYGADGTVNGAILTEDRFGNPGSAFYFNGIDNSITIPGNLRITNSFTISFWAYPERESGYSNVLTDGGINYGGNDFLINFRNNDIGIRADKAGSPLNYEDSSYPELTNLNFQNRWVHVVWVMDPASSKVYLDGYKIAEINEAGTNEGYHDEHVTIGARHVWTNMDNFFKGKLDEFRIYNCNLQPDEIYGIYSAEGPVLPSLGIIFLSDTTATSISVGSNILSDGGSSITERGVCWSTSPNPTINDNRTLDGTGTGFFTSQITGLLPGTTYYVRSYATNSAGTTYGSELSFSTNNTFPNCGTVTDIDGNTYNTVTIGTQCWMRENLRTTKYNDGVNIPLIEDSLAWLQTITPGYSWYNNDITTYKETLGAFYNWYVVNRGNLCPQGWHVPSDFEWTLLEDYLLTNNYNFDGTNTGNKYAKSLAASTSWNLVESVEGAPGNLDYPDYRNKSGFTALASGYRNSDASFYMLGSATFFWSATEQNSEYAYFRRIYSNFVNMTVGAGKKQGGASIRCIKNAEQELPTVVTSIVTDITSTTATAGGNVTSEGSAPVTVRGLCWSTSSGPTITDQRTHDGTGNGLFSSILTGLTPGTTYYYRSYATNDFGTAYGNELTFTALTGLAIGQPYQGGFIAYILHPGDPTYESEEAKGLIIAPYNQSSGIKWHNGYNSNSGSIATGLGAGKANTMMIVESQGDGLYAAKLCDDLVIDGYDDWYLPSKDELNLIYNNREAIGGIENDGFWSSSEISTSDAWSQWFNDGYQGNFGKGLPIPVRAIRSFTTSTASLPTIITTEPTTLLSTEAVCGGIITNDGGSPIVAAGLCWSASNNPTLADNKINEISGSTSFNGSLGPLNPATKYFVRAYAVNNAGISYGNEICFTTDPPAIGDTYAGGIVFYLDETGQHGLVCAPYDIGNGAEWGCSDTEINGADGTAVGTGYQNTIDIINGCSTPGIAARICSDLVLNDYDDWFMPSKDELALMYNNLRAYGLGNFTIFYYWSSTEGNSSGAWIHGFQSNATTIWNKLSYAAYLRPIRAF